MLERFDGWDEYDLNELATSLSNNFPKQQTISTRAFGIVFGITITKAAIVTEKKVKKSSVKDYLAKCKFSSQHQKEIIGIVTSLYSNYQSLRTSNLS